MGRRSVVDDDPLAVLMTQAMMMIRSPQKVGVFRGFFSCVLLTAMLLGVTYAQDVPKLPESVAEETQAETKGKTVPSPEGAAGKSQLSPEIKLDTAPTLLEPVLTPEAQAGEQYQLEDLIAIALANNPSIRQASQGIEVARGVHTQVGLYPNPDIGWLATQMRDKGTPGQQGGWVGQQFVTGKKLRWNQAIAIQDVAQAEWYLEQQKWRVENAVRLRYYEILASQRSLQLVEKLAITAERAANTSRQLRQAGEGTKTDVLQAEIEVEQAEILQNNARRQYSAAWRRLAATIGMPGQQATPVAGSLEVPVPEFDFETTLSEIWAASPELQAARTGVARAQAAIQRAQVEPIPNLDTQISGQRDFGARENIMNAQIGMKLPIWNRNQGGRYAAMSNLYRAESEVERLELSLRDRLAKSFQRYEVARLQVERYRERIIPRSQETLELVNSGYKQGELNFLQVLVAQRTYFQTNLAYVEALTNLWKSTVDITGQLLTEDSSNDTVATPDTPNLMFSP